MSIDAIGNFLTITRNRIMASRPSAVAPHSKMNEEIARVLKQEGFIKDFQIDSSDPVKKQLTITLKYVGGESVIHEIKRVSTPGKRTYSKVKNIKPVIGGFGISILTTNRGIMTDKQAKDSSTKIGGEVICTVW